MVHLTDVSSIRDDVLGLVRAAQLFHIFLAFMPIYIDFLFD